MTFTNKAALEMKERIIKALDEISHPVFNGNANLALKNELAQKLSISVEDVEKRCKLVLENILHNYEEFHVLTIDKFNLRLIKSFSRDLNLPHDFEVVLNESDVIEKIVDQLLDQLNSTHKSELNRIILEYAKSNVEEGTSWNFRSKLIEFGKVLNSEKNIPFVASLLNLDLTIEHQKKLQNQLNELKKGYKVKFIEFEEKLQNNSLDKTSLPGGGNTINDINGILKKPDYSLKDNPIGKRLAGNIEITGSKEIPASLRNILRALSEYWEDNIEEYTSLSLFLNNYFNMALLQYMAGQLHDIRKGEQIIRISEFNTLISELIQQEDAPFIYERLGNKFAHFLLDEFQDTSHLQWLNLIPLIHESLSQGNSDLIVGDPKQSIYRFKNGVAEQFIALPGIYNPGNNPAIESKSNYFKDSGSVEELLDNWRSSPTIVDFNNRFFTCFRERMGEKAKGFYSSIIQTPKSKLSGSVQITSKEIDDEIDLLPVIVAQIEESLAAGFRPNDICILGNTNLQCNQWAMGLNDEGYRVVSSDSLLINSDTQVQLVIAYLKWRLRPAGENEKRQFAELFLRMKGLSYSTYSEFVEHKKFQDKDFLIHFFGSKEKFFFRYENLYDLVQRFIKVANLDELKNAYLHHLADYIFSFNALKGPDLKEFLKDYDTNKNKIAVQIPESDDAVQVMTLHKSKGLEFPVVIIPSINFNLNIKGKHFVEIEDKLIYKIPTKNERLKPIIEIYNSESEQIFIDDVNLLYVGMTRPISRLYITNYYHKDKFGAHFHSVLESMDDAKTIDGMLVVRNIDSKEVSLEIQNNEESLFHPSDSGKMLWFPDIALRDNIEDNDTNHLSESQKYGIQFHDMISKIDKVTDIPAILAAAEKGGAISSIYMDELKVDLRNLLTKSGYERILDGAYRVYNEQNILANEDEVLRPDKLILKDNETIIVDFKTGTEKKKDLTQVSRYKEVLEEMGYPKVSCYLYYTATKSLKQVS